MARQERYTIGPNLLRDIRSTIQKVDALAPHTSGPTQGVRYWDMQRPPRGGGGGHGFRLGQFSGQWPNEPGAYGSGNVKVVTLFTMRTPQNNPNDYVPELDSNGDNVTAVTLNLFSHIPTQTAGDMPLWCLVMPFGGPGQYVSGYSYNEETESYDIPIYTDYSTLWLLVAAEC